MTIMIPEQVSIFQTSISSIFDLDGFNIHLTKVHLDLFLNRVSITRLFRLEAKILPPGQPSCTLHECIPSQRDIINDSGIRSSIRLV
ncbi:hypothetical protein AVEN_156028-1 [Araneus ventricosus]|uniref:Uncharacterized protein n=1 Tax=Araneus ventricosus TaxID=182803 RepID=A0A4Y2H5J7_ARAVE|nr:hypothetical protein AVEN_156028-1 [Araneus ventricosus]